MRERLHRLIDEATPRQLDIIYAFVTHFLKR